MKIIRSKQQASRNGAALVEAAMVLPIFFLAIVGIVEFGRGMMVSQMVTNASREGARQAVLDGSTNAAIRTYIETKLSGALNVAPADVDIQITITPDPSNSTTGHELANAQPYDLATINVSVPFDKVSFFAGGFMQGKHLKAETTMRHE